MFVCVAAEARPPAHPGVSAREAASVVVGEAGVAQEWVLGTMKMRIVYIIHTNGSFNGAIFNFYLLIVLVPWRQPGPALVTHLSLAECVLQTSKLHSGPSEHQGNCWTGSNTFAG